MLKRRLLQAVVGIGVAMASLIGMSTAASAAPASFYVASVHGGGTGAVGAAMKANLTWYNRSVVATNVKVYVHALECGRGTIYAYAGSTGAATAITREFCAPADTGEWFNAANLELDGGSFVGGITMLTIYIQDYDHDGEASITCYRSRSTCS